MTQKFATKSIGMLMYGDFEILDFCGPYEVFSVASRFQDPPAFRVFAVAEAKGTIVSHNGLSFVPDYAYDDCPAMDILLVPGGIGSRKQLENETTLSWIAERTKKAELVLSVCTGALLLGKLGMLDGLQVTTHHSSLKLLQQIAPKAMVRDDQRFFDNGRIITSAGIAAGIDMSLHIVARLLGREIAEKTCREMEYPYTN